MNEFEPQSIKRASKYLDDKLEYAVKEKKPQAYILEKKKRSLFSRIITSLFRS